MMSHMIPVVINDLRCCILLSADHRLMVSGSRPILGPFRGL